MIKTFKTPREKFPILNNKIQLSSCSQSALHVEVKNAINRYVHSWEEEGMDWEGWMTACENARSIFAKMINASPSEVAIVSSVSHGVSSIATSLSNKARKKVLITDFDFPTIGHVWLSHSDQYDIEFIGGNENGIIGVEDYLNSIDEETLIVGTSHVSYYNGYKQDLKEIAKVVHGKGSYLFVDAYQSFGQSIIDVNEIGIDMLSTGLQKYALGTPGLAFLYVKQDLAKSLVPKITGWFGQSNPFGFDIKNVNYGEHAKRFDTGTFPMINGFAAEAALNILNQYQMSDIEKYLQHLSRVAIDEAEERGLLIKSPTDVEKKGSNTAIYVNNASEVEHRLREKNILVSARNDVIRIAPHFYNEEEDIKKAVRELARFIN
ncbi:putative aminotransferase YcbU [Lentibacillus populi]|uniref:Aminotransferase YcbU n=1 Tax=Lentibacillus populi TaxID=1827502 RepID=A0A9W5U0N3_9BACI|nr:aminotransferase class V-fold PLP-dependent enzyme [Lentibacillus populi]GGB57892.1 putative aminotransferase YcbU [Lentibacillus populi]